MVSLNQKFLKKKKDELKSICLFFYLEEDSIVEYLSYITIKIYPILPCLIHIPYMEQWPQGTEHQPPASLGLARAPCDVLTSPSHKKSSEWVLED